MRFLTKLIKTPEEDQNEDQDEFDAEKKGLLMIPSLPGNQEEGAASTTPAVEAINAAMPAAEGAAPGPPAQGEAVPNQDQLGQFPAAESGPFDATQGSSLSQDPASEAAEKETVMEEGSSDDPMQMFRATAKHTQMAPALKEGLEDVSIADLLAEARAVRSSLGGQGASSAGQGKQRAA